MGECSESRDTVCRVWVCSAGARRGRSHDALLPNTTGVDVYDLPEVPLGDGGRFYLQYGTPTGELRRVLANSTKLGLQVLHA